MLHRVTMAVVPNEKPFKHFCGGLLGMIVKPWSRWQHMFEIETQSWSTCQTVRADTKIIAVPCFFAFLKSQNSSYLEKKKGKSCQTRALKLKDVEYNVTKKQKQIALYVYIYLSAGMSALCGWIVYICAESLCEIVFFFFTSECLLRGVDCR